MDDFAAGIATNRLPATGDLVGRGLIVLDRDGTATALDFTGADRVQWTRTTVDGEKTSGEDWYEAVAVRPGLFFLQQRFADDVLRAEVTVLDTGSGRTLRIDSVIGDTPRPGAPRVDQVFTPGVLEGLLDVDAALPGSDGVAEETRDLIGWRALYRYSPNHLYEHVYLSSQRYAWQCLVGEQRGHGDIDLASTWKFGEDLYVFTFREFKIPVAATWLYDFSQMRSTGMFLGLGAGGVTLAPGGAYITELNRTVYPRDAQPV
ncbi:MoaF C-terminal domain-containing protein [Catenulispora yoronensis]